MTEYACMIVPVYVKPQSMNDEKACIGIVARCSELGYLAYRIADDEERVIRYGASQALISANPAQEFDRLYAEIVGIRRLAAM